MSPTAKRFHDLHLKQAQLAEAVGNAKKAAHHRRCALTYTFPVGELIASLYN
jgi:hypothetical protein